MSGSESARVSLSLAGEDGLRIAYRWLYGSDKPSWVFGYERPEQVLVPTEEEFIAEHGAFFFDGSAPESGLHFSVLLDGRPVGLVGYSGYHLEPGFAEIDIWLDAESRCGKGVGTRALELLLDYLEEVPAVLCAVARVSRINPRAIAAFAKAGFTAFEDDISTLYTDPSYLLGDTGEAGDVFLSRRLGRRRV